MSKTIPICINDGEVFDSEKLNDFQINNLLRSTNGTTTINFVGVIVSRNNILLSFLSILTMKNFLLKKRKSMQRVLLRY